MRWRRVPAPEALSAGPAMSRLAALLEAGVAPAVAWRHLADRARGAQELRVLAATAEATAAGGSGASSLARAVASAPAEAVARAEWLQVAAAWHVAEATGAPLAATLRAGAEAARDLAQARREASVAAAGPRATARIVLALPAVGVLLAVLMGVDAPRVLFATPAGWICLVGAGLLVGAARAWNARLFRAAAPPDGIPGLELDLVAIGLSGGGGWGRARACAASALEAFCPGSASAAPAASVLSAASALDDIEALSVGAGVPGAALLRGAADELRREARARAAADVERLGVRLMLPLGICVLPAFVLVGVVPLGIALLRGGA